jgi:hypothetical protein
MEGLRAYIRSPPWPSRPQRLLHVLGTCTQPSLLCVVSTRRSPAHVQNVPPVGTNPATQPPARASEPDLTNDPRSAQQPAEQATDQPGPSTALCADGVDLPMPPTIGNLTRQPDESAEAHAERLLTGLHAHQEYVAIVEAQRLR